MVFFKTELKNYPIPQNMRVKIFDSYEDEKFWNKGKNKRIDLKIKHTAEKYQIGQKIRCQTNGCLFCLGCG